MYIVDRILDDIVILENSKTKEMIEINKDLLPVNIKEGSILDYKNNKFINNYSLEEERRKNIRDKFNRLKNK